MLGLGLGLTPGNPLLRAGGITEAQVFAGAGVTSGVTPGVADGVTPGNTGVGRTTINGATQGVYTITNEADAIALSQLATFGGGGTGTEADPYVFKNAYPYAFTAANGDTTAVIYWNHDAVTYPSEVYWIKFDNCQWGTGVGNTNRSGNLYINAPTGGGAIIQNGDFDNQQTLDGGILAPIVAVRGTTRLVECKATRMNTGIFIYKNGADAIVEVIDSLFDTSLGSWTAGLAFFHNAVAGGSALFRRCTFDLRAGIPIWYGTNIAMTIDRVLWNSSDNANAQGFIFTSTGYLTASWTSGLTMTDCRAYAGATVLLGWTTPSSNRTIANWTISRCEFIASAGRIAAARLVGIGDQGAGVSGTCDNVTFSWCRFVRPEATGIAAGAEAVHFFGASNTLVEYCWINHCGEDGYEFQTPWDNVGIRYSGGGGTDGTFTPGSPPVAGSSTVGGNMVDFYGEGANWTNSTNCFADHLWGTAGADAIIVDSCTNVTVNNIDIDNSAADFVDNVARSNVRLHARFVNGLNGVTVTRPLTAVAESWDSRPCYLTREPTAETTITGTEVTGETVLTVASSAGMSGGMMVGIELATGGMYQTTISSVAPGEITIPAPGLPSDSKLNGEVYAVSAFNAGTVSWPEWNGSSFDTRGGTAGGVAEMASI